MWLAVCAGSTFITVSLTCVLPCGWLCVQELCGVVEHGLFCGMSTAVIIAGSDGITVQNPK